MKNTKLMLLCSMVAASSAYLSANTFVVTTCKDTGKGSLREAICKANECGDASYIRFKIPKKDRGYDTCANCWCIKLCKELPVICSEVYIDGYSQPKSRPNCSPINKPHSACIKVKLCGPGMKKNHGLNGFTGLMFGPGSESSTVCGLAVTDCQIGIKVAADYVKILGNFLGVDCDGMTPCPNLVSVCVSPGAQGTCIGNGDLSSRNLISGCGARKETATAEVDPFDTLGAISIFGDNTAVQNTTVNLTRQGDAIVLPEALLGIVSTCTIGTILGGPEFSQGIVVSGHTIINILLDSTDGDTVQHALVGTDNTGTQGLGGGTGLMLLGRFECLEAEDTVSTGHTVERSLFSGHETNGVELGSLSDVHQVTDVVLTKIKAGTDITGQEKIPNKENGIKVVNAANIVVSESLLRFNGLNGFFQQIGFDTIVRSTNTTMNGLGGTCVETIKRPDDVYEIRTFNTRVIQNGMSAIMTPCGSVDALPDPTETSS